MSRRARPERAVRCPVDEAPRRRRRRSTRRRRGDPRRGGRLRPVRHVRRAELRAGAPPAPCAAAGRGRRRPAHDRGARGRRRRRLVGPAPDRPARRPGRGGHRRRARGRVGGQPSPTCSTRPAWSATPASSASTSRSRATAPTATSRPAPTPAPQLLDGRGARAAQGRTGPAHDRRGDVPRGPAAQHASAARLASGVPWFAAERVDAALGAVRSPYQPPDVSTLEGLAVPRHLPLRGGRRPRSRRSPRWSRSSRRSAGSSTSTPGRPSWATRPTRSSRSPR